MPFNLFISSLYNILYFIILLSLDNNVVETSKNRAMFYNILSQNFIVKCFTKSPLIRVIEVSTVNSPMKSNDHPGLNFPMPAETYRLSDQNIVVTID